MALVKHTYNIFYLYMCYVIYIYIYTYYIYIYISMCYDLPRSKLDLGWVGWTDQDQAKRSPDCLKPMRRLMSPTGFAAVSWIWTGNHICWGFLVMVFGQFCQPSHCFKMFDTYFPSWDSWESTIWGNGSKSLTQNPSVHCYWLFVLGRSHVERRSGPLSLFLISFLCLLSKYGQILLYI